MAPITLPEINERRINKLEELVAENHKETTAELKALSADVKTAIKEGFKECREIAPLTCPIGKGRVTVVQATAICTVTIGVVMTLIKLGLLDFVLKSGGV